jgi:hypothetical protein
MDSSVYHYPKQKEMRKLVEIDKSEQVRSWQYEIVDLFNQDQSTLQECLECCICYEIIIKPLTCPFCANVFCQHC